MNLFGNTERQFIDWPDETKNQILFKWRDTNIRLGAQLTVEQDELAVFLRSGRIQGTLGPGRHSLDSSEIPFLSNLLDAATGGRFLVTELYFAGAREYANLPFGGMVDNVTDPETQLAVGLRVYGDYSLRVVEPQALIVNLAGTRNLTDNDQVTDWVRDQLLKVFRTDVVQHIGAQGWPILGLAAHSQEIEQQVLALVQPLLGPYGLEVTRLGNFTLSLKPEDEQTLKTYRAQVQYTKLAGGFQQAAAGQALEGIGEGAAAGGGTAGAAGFGAGLALGGFLGVQGPARVPAGATTPGTAPVGLPPAAPDAQATAATAPPAPTPAPAPLGIQCARCHTYNPSSARFCFNCGSPFGEAA